ncbi:MAG: ComF family protein [Oscillospiraceae bacterium]|nr:ComF family protein [Oscillospiraceae bacterium]
MQIFDALLDLLFPPKCPFCRTFLEKGELLCPACQKELPWLAGRLGESKVEFTKGCVSTLRYEGNVRKAIHRYKFSGVRAYSKTFGALVARTAEEHGLTADLISWPSVSKKRLRERGYDQAELLAREVGKALGLPVLRTVDKSHRPAQSGIEDKDERRANLLGAYTAVGSESFKGKTVLLVDDVVTSGATLSECARTLRTAGAEMVFCVTLAKAGK